MNVPRNRWFHIGDEIKPPTNSRVLVCSPVHEGDPMMHLRLLDSQFLPICKDVEYWMLPSIPGDKS